MEVTNDSKLLKNLKNLGNTPSKIPKLPYVLSQEEKTKLAIKVKKMNVSIKRKKDKFD